jgi:DNA helicase-2/ATP-dependent DNA helicase PcrA
MTEHALNEPQQTAVAHLDGPLLVFAGAGSGKTRTITYRVANLLANGVAPYRILAVTFTNKAAKEMRDRLEKVAGPELARDLWVGTFHSTCAKLLRRFHTEVGLERNFAIYDDSDQKAVMTRILRELGESDREYPPKAVLAKIHSKKQEGELPDDVEQSRSFDGKMLDFYRRYQRALMAANAVDFEDLLLYVAKLAEARTLAGEEIRSMFDQVLVDEFQDTNAVQYRLVRALSARTRCLCVVGDDDQSIYRWRGADVRIIRGFRRDFPDALVVKLEQNYRSTANIVRAALAVIEPASSREPKKLWTSSAAGEKLVVRAVVDERDEAAYTVKAIRSRINHGIEASNIAVFYRVHAQSRVLEEAMRADNIPYQVVGGMRFFDRAEVKDIIAYLRLVDNPRSDADLLRIVNVPARGIGKRTIDAWTSLASERGTSLYDCLPALLQADTLNNGGKKKLQAFYDLIDGFRSHAATLLPHELARKIVDESSYRAHLVEQDNAEGDARLGNVEEFIGSIEEYEQDAEAAGEAPTLLSYLERVALVTATDTMRDVPKVSLMTVHAAKGLEFDTVILTGMEDGIFPYTRVDGGGPEDEDDERRLAYVALTRARHHLFITHSTQRSIFGQTRYLCQSPFLLDIPEECTEVQSSPGRFSSSASRSFRADPYAGVGRRQHDEFDQRESYHFDEDGDSRQDSGQDSGQGPGRGTSIEDSQSSSYGGSRGSYPSTRNATPGRLGGLRTMTGAGSESRVDRTAFDDLKYSDAAPAAPTFRTGQVVEHARFGRGRVERVESGGESLAVVAKFPGFGSRKILAKFLLTTTSSA